ncbi:hypothetical protein L1049_003452 [Liquidambar formosana]|uniref:Uncharacterized protein n=1 Tax=Liquidambar formosana TaxID=63359 RepID=A0AAP0N6B9_LIQFO
MDPRLLEAIVRNDTPTFISLVRENEGVLEQRTADSSNTVLHLASKFGHIELVMEIVKLRPDMVAAENKKLETPLHEACRQGKVRVVMPLLEMNRWVACKLNCENQSALFMACCNGHVNVVKLLLNQPWLLGLEEDGVDQNYLHVAASRGHTDIVRKILNVCPNLAQKIDKNGFSPLHYACCRGHLEITKMLLRLDPDLSLHFNNNGYTPLHLAAMNGKAAILEEFLSTAPTSFQFLTEGGETVFHLTIRFNHYNAFVCLAQVFNATYLIHQPDQYGNTILHLAVSGGQYRLAAYIINETIVDISYRNYRGHTVLDILNQNGQTIEIQHLKQMLEKAKGKESIRLPFLAPEVKEINPQPLTLESPREALEKEYEKILEAGSREFRSPMDYKAVNRREHLRAMDTGTNSREDSQHQVGGKSESLDAELWEMDPRLLEAIVRNDIPTFISLVRKNEGVLEHRTANSLNTVLHLASKFGHSELAMEIHGLRPDLVVAKNKKLELDSITRSLSSRESQKF